MTTTPADHAELEALVIQEVERRVGDRGQPARRTGARRMLLGSVAEDVVTRAHCPVTVVR